MKRTNIVVLGLIFSAGAFICGYDLLTAYRANGTLSFPLDDPWIHLQFAKNLHNAVFLLFAGTSYDLMHHASGCADHPWNITKMKQGDRNSEDVLSVGNYGRVPMCAGPIGVDVQRIENKGER
jgi:hypothetical protein